MLLLNKENIRSVFSMKDAVETDKECYRLFSEGQFDVPLRAVISGSHGNFLFMPAYCESMSAAGLKIVNIMPDNPKKDLPASIGQVLLIDGETGEVRSIMDGTYVFGRADAETGAIIGTGSQAMCQLEAMLSVRKLKEVRVAARNYAKTKAFVEAARKELSSYVAEIIACEETNAAVDGADLVTLVTISGTPVCSADYFKPGCTISAVGAYTYDMQELDPAVFEKCGKLYFDSVDAVLSESGDILRPLDEGTLSKDQFTGDIGEFLLGNIPGRESDDEIIVFENVGIGALDLMTAARIYDKAVKAGVGVEWE